MRDRELRNKWQIFEFLKENDGWLDVKKLNVYFNEEITEGIIEYLLWLRN